MVLAQAPGENRATIRNIIGEAEVQRGGKENWNPARVNSLVREKDRLRTKVESQVFVQFGQGSTITIEENSLVDFSVFFEKEGLARTKVDVKSGRVLFNIQRIAGSRSSFELETATATAAIRGTAGGLGIQGNRSFAFLTSGRMDLQARGAETVFSLSAHQIALQTAQGFQRYSLPSGQSPEVLNKLLQQILQDTTANLDKIFTAISDTVALQNQTKTQDTAQTAGHGCRMDPLPESVGVALLTLGGTCPDGTEISVGTTRTVAVNGRWSLDLAWPGHQYGVRNIVVQCRNASGEFSCGEGTVQYIKELIPLSLQLNTPRSLVICREPLMLAGSYRGTDARLTARLGNRVIDLSGASGQFSRTIPFSDVEGNWELPSVQLVLSGNGETITEEIRLQADKTCREVNRLPPQLTVQVQQETCQFLLNVSGVQGDRITLKTLVNGVESPSTEFSGNVRSRRLAMQPGENDYWFRAIDLAGNSAEKHFRRLGCWPEVHFDIVVEGPAREVLRIPPAPPNSTVDIVRSMRFRLQNLPSDDPRYIQRVSVRHQGRLLREWNASQLDRVDFSLDIPLQRGANNQVRIEVIPRTGRLRTASKEYDLR